MPSGKSFFNVFGAGQSIDWKNFTIGFLLFESDVAETEADASKLVELFWSLFINGRDHFLEILIVGTLGFS